MCYWVTVWWGVGVCRSLKLVPSDNFNAAQKNNFGRDSKSDITFLFLEIRSSSLDMFELYVWKREIRDLFWKFHFWEVYTWITEPVTNEKFQKWKITIPVFTLYWIPESWKQPAHCMELAAISAHPHAFLSKLIHKILWWPQNNSCMPQTQPVYQSYWHLIVGLAIFTI